MDTGFIIFGYIVLGMIIGWFLQQFSIIKKLVEYFMFEGRTKQASLGKVNEIFKFKKEVIK